MLPQMKNDQPVLMESSKATYSACISDFLPYATATDIVTLIGATGKQITLTQIRFSGTATAATTYGVYLFKRSALDTAGTSTLTSITTHDSNDPAPSAVVKQYSAIPTGLGAGTMIRSDHLSLPATAGAAYNQVVWNFGEGVGKCPKLLSSLENYAINCNGVAVPAGSNIHITIQWTEE